MRPFASAALFVLFCTGCATVAPVPPVSDTVQLIGVEQIRFDLNAKKLTFAPLLENVERSPMSRQINAAFAFDPKKPPRTMFAANAEAGTPNPTAFEQPATLRIGAERVAVLQREIDLVLRLLLDQEQKHGFHGSAVAAAATGRPFAIEVVDEDRADIVRSRCEASRVVLSAGFIRRLLERSIAAAGGRILQNAEKPEFWPTSEEGSWPPSLTYTIAHWRSLAASHGVTMSPTVRKMFEIERRLSTEVIPLIDAALAKAGRPPDLDTFQEIYEDDSGSSVRVLLVLELKEELHLEGSAKQTIDAIAAEAHAFYFEPNEKATEESEVFENEVEEMGELVLEPLGETFILARFAQEQYLKALAFVVAHEAAHLWIDGCATPTNETENTADAYATLVSFELFHGQQSRFEIENGNLELPAPRRDDTTMEKWMLESLGWSGFDVIAETFGRSGIAPDPMHDKFSDRSERVLELYAGLVQTVMTRTETPP